MDELYRSLAERNGWSYSVTDNRPYFMKDGKYAVPDETTSNEDKELLANIISEGSTEMEQLILLCWNNGVNISGPCSGISEFHNKPPHSLHFTFNGNKDLIEPLYQKLLITFPNFKHLCREQNNTIRYDIDYPLNGIELTTEQSNQIFSIIKEEFELEIGKDQIKRH